MRLASKIFLATALLILGLVGIGAWSLRAVNDLVRMNREMIRHSLPALHRETLLEELRFRMLLLVLDYCEHHVETSPALADDVLRTCPGVRILATSREPLRVHGERVWRVPPLPTPDPDVTLGMGEMEKNPRGAVIRRPGAGRSSPGSHRPPRVARLWRRSASVSMAYPWQSNWPPRERKFLHRNRSWPASTMCRNLGQRPQIC